MDVQMTTKPTTLDLFELWCKGEGRGGKGAGVHYSAVDAVQRFRMYLASKEKKRD